MSVTGSTRAPCLRAVVSADTVDMLSHSLCMQSTGALRPSASVCDAKTMSTNAADVYFHICPSLET